MNADGTVNGERNMVRRTTWADRREQRPFKIVVTGPFAAGKTTLIRCISEIAVVGTEREITDQTRDTKEQTTVAMDFGRITLDEDLTLYLFGTPGQRRFEVMWEILSEGMLGFILLVNAGDDRSLEEAVHILETFHEYAEVPFVVGVTHLDSVERPAAEVLADVRLALGVGDEIGVVACDPRNREDVKDLILEVLLGVLNLLEEPATSGA